MSERGKTGIFAFFILVVLMSSSLVAAFGVAIPYWDSPEWYPLKLAPGESKIVTLTLQNTEPEDMMIQATINSEIAALEGDVLYPVPSGEVNVPARIRVSVPEDTEIGTKYKVYTTFQQVTSGEGGMVRLAGALTTNFPVEVVGEQESELYSEGAGQGLNPVWYVVIGLIVLGILIAVLRKPSKK